MVVYQVFSSAVHNHDHVEEGNNHFHYNNYGSPESIMILYGKTSPTQPTVMRRSPTGKGNISIKQQQHVHRVTAL
jgi:hypothetical protein